MAECAYERRQTSDVAHGHAAAAHALQSIVRPDQGRLDGAVGMRERLDCGRRDAASGGDVRRVEGAHAFFEPLEAECMAFDVITVDEVVADEHVHQAERERAVGPREQRDMLVTFLRRERTIGVDRDEPRAAALRLLRARPEMHARGDRIASPENDELRILRDLDIHTDARAERDAVAGGSRGGADGALEQAGAEPVKEPLRHGLALHETHGAGIAIRQDAFGIVGGDVPEALGDARNRLFPRNSLEAPFSFLADAPHRMQQPLWVIGSLGVASHLGTENSRRRAVIRGARDLQSDAVLHVHLERTGIGTIVRTRGFHDLNAAVAPSRHAGKPPSRIRPMNTSQSASCSSATNSFGRCASAMSPGPRITVGTPICLNRPASVPYETLPVDLLRLCFMAHCTIASLSAASRPMV